MSNVIHQMVQSVLSEMARPSAFPPERWIEFIVDYFIEKKHDPNVSVVTYADQRGIPYKPFQRALKMYRDQALERMKTLGHNPKEYEQYAQYKARKGAMLNKEERIDIVVAWLTAKAKDPELSQAAFAKDYGLSQTQLSQLILTLHSEAKALISQDMPTGSAPSPHAPLPKISEPKPKVSGIYIGSMPYIKTPTPTGSIVTTQAGTVLPDQSFTYVPLGVPKVEQPKTSSPDVLAPSPSQMQAMPGEERTLKGWGSIEQRKPKVLFLGGQQRNIPHWMSEYFNLQHISWEQDAQRAMNQFSRQGYDAIVLTRWISHALTKPFQERAKNFGIPVLVANPGIAAAVEMAKQKKVAWFVDAFNKGKKESPDVEEAILDVVSNHSLSETLARLCIRAR